MVPNNQPQHDPLLGADLFTALLDGFSPMPSPNHIPSYMNSPEIRPRPNANGSVHPVAPPGAGPSPGGGHSMLTGSRALTNPGPPGGGHNFLMEQRAISQARPPGRGSNWLSNQATFPESESPSNYNDIFPPFNHEMPALVLPEGPVTRTAVSPGRPNARKRSRTPPTPGSTLATNPVERKKNREKQRRLDVNNKFEELHKLISKVEEAKEIPSRASGAANKVEVLSRAIKVIKHLWGPSTSATKSSLLLPKEKEGSQADDKEIKLEETTVPKPVAAPTMPQWPMIIMPMFLPNPPANPTTVPKKEASTKWPKGFPASFAGLAEQMRASTEAAKESMTSADEVTTHACAA